MTSADADRLIVAFAELVGAQRVLVVGSQAVHAFYPDPPVMIVVASREIHVVPLPFEDFERWYYYAHERMGADSQFDEENGIYVDMLREHAAKLPVGWELRVREKELRSEHKGVITVVYPDLYDVAAAKLIANRPQGEAFLRGLRRLGEIDRDVLEAHIALVELPSSKKQRKKDALDTVARVFENKET